MTKNRLAAQASGTVLVALIAGLGVSCQKTAPAAPASLAQAPLPVATLPLSDAPATAPAMAPPVSALPAYQVRRARVARPQDEYAFADRADQAAYGFGDAPPDYAFEYQGGRPWAWQGDDGHQVVVEPLPGGADRYYYYQPGASTPYFVRDRDYAYGYQDGALVVVYDRFGHPLPQAEQDRRWDDAGRYAWRAQALWRAARGQHYAVARSNWQSRRDAIAQSQSQWTQARDQNPDWRAYHDQYGAGDQSFWEQQRYRREAEAYRVDQSSNDAGRARHDREAALAVAGAAAAGGAFLAAHHDHGPQGRAAPAAFVGQPAPVEAPPAPPRGAFGPAPSRQAGQFDPRAQIAAQQAARNQSNAAVAAQAAAQARLHSDAAARQAAVSGQQQAARQAAAQAQAQRQAEQARQAQVARQAGAQAQAAKQAAAQAQAQRQVEQARQAEVARQAGAQAQAAKQAAAQAQAQRQAEQARQAEVARQVGAQAQAARQASAPAQAQRQAEIARQAGAQAAKQAQVSAARDAQAQAQAAKQAQGRAQAQAAQALAAQAQAAQAKARAAQDARIQAQQAAKEAAIAKAKAEHVPPPSKPGEKLNTPNP